MIKIIKLISITIILFSVVACQQSTPNEVVLPTLVVLPSEVPTATPSITPSLTLTLTMPLPTPTMTITSTPRPSDTPTPTMTAIIIPTLATLNIAPPTPPPPFLPEQFIFGNSVQGQNLVARRIGHGDKIIMMVGGIHGGWESNTVTLVNELISYFEASPQDILPGIRLLFVPALNPDGVALGQTLNGRFNANRVDLNRNWGCHWESIAYFRETAVNPGSEPFSEPETIALAALINDVHPAIVLFYHSAANAVYAGDCNDSGTSVQMSAVLGQATGYSYGQAFSEYPVSGTASTWVDGLGIPSADVELASSEHSEFQRNLRGIMALQCWLLGDMATELLACP
jgi:hypothetical protein